MSAALPVSPLVMRVIGLTTARLGVEEVARRIDASAPLLQAWRDGHAAMPREKFLQLVDVLLDLDVGWDEWDR